MIAFFVFSQHPGRVQHKKVGDYFLSHDRMPKGAFQKRGHFFSPERAAHTSPGQRPGKLLKKILSPVRALHK